MGNRIGAALNFYSHVQQIVRQCNRRWLIFQQVQIWNTRRHMDRRCNHRSEPDAEVRRDGHCVFRRHRCDHYGLGNASAAHIRLQNSGGLPLEPRAKLITCAETLADGNRNVTYPGSANGIVEVSFGVKRSELIVITGRIGCGKTTLLRTILGLLPKASGTLSWNNLDVADPGEFMVPPRTAYTPQVPLLFSGSLRDNILLGIPEDIVDLEEIVAMAVMDRDLAALDGGLDTIVGTKGVRLSGGQAQRTAAARMFARDAEVIFLDDLSSALDVETEQQLWDNLRDLRNRKETTCIAVSHRRPAFLAADRILVMVDGRLEADGRLPDLLETSSEMHGLWEGEWDRK